MKRLIKFPTLIIIFLAFYFPVLSQGKYYPQGDPDKFQVQATVPLWLPWIGGELGVDGMIKDVEGDINATPAGLLSNLKAALMLNVDLSKGHVIGFVNYMHLKLETDKAQVQRAQNKSYEWSVTAKNDVLDMAIGGRIHFSKGMIDPYFGVRYFSLDNALTLTDSASTKSGSKKLDFLDPFFGARFFYYPKERLMLFLKTDIGGIWGGDASFSFNLEAKVGYAISPTIDIAGGFRSWNFKYAQYSSNTRVFYFNPHFYGFEIAVSFFIPKRSKEGFKK
jgi:hypothetical protein